jgi:hypothetical protein
VLVTGLCGASRTACPPARSCPDTSAGCAPRWPPLPWWRRDRHSGVTADPAHTPAGSGVVVPARARGETGSIRPCGLGRRWRRVSRGAC